MNKFGTVNGKKFGNLFIPDGVPNVWQNGGYHRWKHIYVLTDGRTNHASWILPQNEQHAGLFRDNNYAFVDDWRKADVLIAFRDQVVPNFLAQVKRFLGKRPILVYTHEPYFSGALSHKTTILENKIHFMNVFTGNVWRNNVQYLPYHKTLSLEVPERPVILNPVIALLATYKSEKGAAGKLARVRTEIGLEGTKINIVDIYGRGWPEGVSRGDTRMQYKTTKPIILADYHFNLCFENTHVKNYVTEKIWDSIHAGCLPIYVGSPWIYEIFPKNSFLDYAEIQTPAKLFATVLNMTPKEWYKRMKLCVSAFKKAAELEDDPLWETYEFLFKKLEQLTTM